MTYATGEVRLDRLMIGFLLCFLNSGSSYSLCVDLMFGSNYFKKEKVKTIKTLQLEKEAMKLSCMKETDPTDYFISFLTCVSYYTFQASIYELNYILQSSFKYFTQ